MKDGPPDIERAGPPHLQLVRYVAYSVHHGVFGASPHDADAEVMTTTVLCRGDQYYGVPGLPRRYLSSLLDEDRYPGLARPRVELKELKAGDDRSALEAALAVLTGEPEG